MTTISHRSHPLEIAPILFRPTADAPATPAPEFDVDASLAATGWLDIHTREQLAAALREKPVTPVPAFYN